MTARAEIDIGRAVVFRLEGERFALDASVVEEALDEVRPQRVPGLPDHVTGVLRHRGAWLPMIDAAGALGVGRPKPRAAALVVRRGGLRFAVGADAVLSMRAAAESDSGDGVLSDDEGVLTPVGLDDLLETPLPTNLGEDAMTDTQTVTVPVALVAFRVGDAELGVGVREVHEVLEYVRPTPVPGAPDFVDGVLDVRGALVPVVDLRTRLGREAGPPDEETRILIGELQGERVGLVVDEVLEVARVAADQIAEPPAYVRGLAAEYLDGLARVGDRTIILLRLDRILNAEERLALLGAELDVPEKAAADRPAPKRATKPKKRRSSS